MSDIRVVAFYDLFSNFVRLSKLHFSKFTDCEMISLGKFTVNYCGDKIDTAEKLQNVLITAIAPDCLLHDNMSGHELKSIGNNDTVAIEIKLKDSLLRPILYCKCIENNVLKFCL